MISLEEFLKYLTIVALSTFKFVGGPLAGIGFGYNIVSTAICTFIGMMITVILFTSFNKQINGLTKRFFIKKDRKVFTKKNRRFVKVWNQYGLKGVAFLTPLLLTPIGGTILANSFSSDKKQIIQFYGHQWFILVICDYDNSFLLRKPAQVIPPHLVFLYPE